MRKKLLHPADLGIDLKSGSEAELFKWFLASLLFGKPIQQQVARRTYGEFAAERLLTPDAILQAGWDKLVEVLDRGHYVRYDFSTATRLLEVSRALKDCYGSVSALLHQSQGPSDLLRRLQSFKGIGPVTAGIFLREVKPLLRGNKRAARKGAGAAARRDAAQAERPQRQARAGSRTRQRTGA